MYSSLEARVPLLDHNIVEFALNLNERLKVKKNVQKHLLKELTYDYIPKKLMERPKRGFSIPLEKWLRTDLGYLIHKYLNESALSKTNIFHKVSVADLLRKFNTGDAYLYNRIWSLIIIRNF